MIRKPATERDTQALFDELRRRAKDDAFLSKALDEVEATDLLLGDDNGAAEETFRLPYSSASALSGENWN